MADELTIEEKVRLLAIFDGKNADDYDREFYEAMYRIKPLEFEEIDGLVRRAILLYITDGQGIASQENNGGLVMMGFIHGYMVGRELKRDIRRKGEGEHASKS